MVGISASRARKRFVSPRNPLRRLPDKPLSRGEQRKYKSHPELLSPVTTPLPPHRIVLRRILLIQPCLQRREIIRQRRRIHSLFPRQGPQRFRPRLALPHRQHRVQLFPCRLVPIHRAPVQGPAVPRLTAKRSLKLKLQNPRQKVSRVRHIARHVILRPRIKIRFRSLHRRRNPLVLLPQFPPCFVVVLRLHFSVEHFPAPLVHQQAKRQEGNLLQRLLQQVINVPRGRRHRVDQSELLQVVRRHGQRNRVAYRFVKSVVRAVLKERRLRVIRPLIKVMPQLVVNHAKIFFRNLDAHLDSHIFLRVHIPGARVTNHVPVRRLGEQRPFPKRLRQRRKSQRRKKPFSVPHHPARIRLPRLQNVRQVVTLRRLRRIHQLIHVVPFLAPKISQKVCRNRPVRRNQLRSIFLSQLPPHVGVQRFIKRPQLLPKPVLFFRELIRWHVVIRAPQRPRIRKTQFPRAFVPQLHHPRVSLPHRRAYRMPSHPRPLQLFRIAARREQSFSRGDVQTFPSRTIRTPLPFSIVSAQRSQHLRQLFLRFGIRWRGKRGGQCQQQLLSRHLRRQLQAIKPVRLFGYIRDERIQLLIRLRPDPLCIVRDEVLLDPLRPLRLVCKFEVALLRLIQKSLCLRHCRHCLLRRPFRGWRVLPHRARGQDQNSQRTCKQTHSLHLFCPHAPFLCDFATTSFSTTSARSTPARSTSQCVTTRTESSAVSCAQTPCGCSASQISTAVFPVFVQSKITMFDRTFFGSMVSPGISAMPSASRFAFS